MKLVRIKDVVLFTTKKLGPQVEAECDAARKLLSDAGIKFSELWYNDPNVDEHLPPLAALSTWAWGVNGAKGQRKFESYPILHWTECYDDWTAHVDHAAGLDEIQNCSLLANKALVG